MRFASVRVQEVLKKWSVREECVVLAWYWIGDQVYYGYGLFLLTKFKTGATMFKSVITTFLVMCVLSFWFLGVVVFYDHDNSGIQTDNRASKDQATVDLLKKFDVNQEDFTASRGEY
ncbi:MAG: hypothetical protein HQM16_15105 [Deltaproteobacteria bacterium]|nr:hypothetical protein [Deltaproteobacteria bacterium]